MAGFLPYDDGENQGGDASLYQNPPAPDGNDFFDAVLGGAGSPLGGLFGAMSPASATYGDSNAFFGTPMGGFGGTPDAFGMPSTLFGGGLGAVQPGGSDQSGIMADLARLARTAFNAGTLGPSTSAPGVPSAYSGDRNTRIAQKIVSEATRLGMDPEMALWVAQNEGGTDDAAANRRNRQGSEAYGPYQLLVHGGLGDTALAQGIDPRDPNSWERQITFALEYAKAHGWGSWEAVTARGIDPWKGIHGYAPPSTPATTPAPSGAATAPAAPMPSAQPGSSPYSAYGTTPASAYSVNFDYDQPYGSAQFNPNIPNHRGVDLIIPGAADHGRGAPVGAFYGGTVEYVSRDPDGGLGVIIHGDDGMYHHYYHLDGANVQMGQHVVRGQQIGILGASGTEGNPHLHYEVADGSGVARHAVDPRPYLNAAR